MSRLRTMFSASSYFRFKFPLCKRSQPCQRLVSSSLAGLVLCVLSIAVSQFSAPVQAFDALLSERDLQAAAFLRETSLRDNNAFAVVESLTTEVGPRLAGSAGDARAVAWAQDKLKSMGFDRVWTEPVSYPSWQRGIETAEVVGPFPQPLVITALGNSIGTGTGGLMAPIIAFDTLEALLAAPEGSAKGKIVFISKAMSKSRDGADYGPTVGARSRGASVAASKGAIACLIRSVGTDHDRLPHTGNQRYATDITPIPTAALSNPDADLLKRMLTRKAPVVVRMTLTSQMGPMVTSANVVAEMRGSDKPDEYILLGAHLDSWDLATGALDDGAGVGIVIGAADAIKRSGFKTRRSVRVVLFANEEQGLYGGDQYFVAHQKAMKQAIAGAEADFGAGPVYRLKSNVKAESLPVVMQMANVLAPLNVDYGGNKAGSGPDMRALHSGGMAVFELALDGTDYFNYHHTANDTLDKVDPAALSQSTAAFATWAFLAAQAPDNFGFANQPKE